MAEERVGEDIDDSFVISMSVNKEDFLDTAKKMRREGFLRLLTVSAIDWIEENKFEVYFIAYNPKEKKYVKVSTTIPRDNPEIDSLGEIWKNAAMHEREAWELFGIKFRGNEMLKPLFLEDWRGPPPFRKDFDLHEYAKQQYEEAMKK